MAKLDRFDDLIPAEPWVNPWQVDGSFEVDVELLVRLLDVAAGTSQRSGVVAGAVDVWAAEELRRAGMNPDDVWPRRSDPRVMPRDVRNFVQRGLTAALRRQVVERYGTSGARRALPAEAHVMGSAYSKQADVLVASWAAGIELMISTKTMLSSYGRNLRNRFEEAYGDAKNLRGRHPLAALGFLFVIGADIEDSQLEFAIDMMGKLTAEPDVYDTACLLVVDLGTEVEEDEEEDERDEHDEPSALVTLEPDEHDEQPEIPLDHEDPGLQPSSTGTRVLLDEVPADLSPGNFFETLLTSALGQMPMAVYPDVRGHRRRARRGR